jgi:hypothetical protein
MDFFFRQGFFLQQYSGDTLNLPNLLGYCPGFRFARRSRPAGRAEYAPTRRRIRGLGFENRAAAGRMLRYQQGAFKRRAPQALFDNVRILSAAVLPSNARPNPPRHRRTSHDSPEARGSGRAYSAEPRALPAPCFICP